MPDYDENDLCIRHARRLIESGRCVMDSDWTAVRPSPDEEEAYLESHGWEEFSAWHLGVDDGAQYDTKDRYGFLIGDFHQVHRSALHACALAASMAGEEAVEQEANELLRRLAALG